MVHARHLHLKASAETKRRNRCTVHISDVTVTPKSIKEILEGKKHAFFKKVTRNHRMGTGSRTLKRWIVI
jgi:hypothetical protein